jgi:hypothetical protein
VGNVKEAGSERGGLVEAGVAAAGGWALEVARAELAGNYWAQGGGAKG